MIKASALMQEAARFSRTLSSRVDVYRGRQPIYSNVPVEGGTLTGDRGSTTRLNCTLTLAFAANEGTDINIQSCRFKVYRGIESIGIADRMQLGEFRIDELNRDESGTITLTGAGLEAYVIDARFLRPRTPPYGASTVGFIRTLITEAIPSAVVHALVTTDTPILMRAPWDSERWDAIVALADTINAEVYCNASGEFVIADAPNLVSDVPVYLVSEGPRGVLVKRSTKDTRDQVYNAVSASGSSSDPNVPPVWGWAYDSDPSSPTYFYADPLQGGFGQVPRFYESQFFNTDAQAQRTAQSLLAQSLAANRSLTFSTVPLSFLEADDTVTVELADHTAENHLIEKFSCTLGIDGTYDCETLSSKVIARATDSNVPPPKVVVVPDVPPGPGGSLLMAQDPANPGLFMVSSSGTIIFLATEDLANPGTWPVVESASLQEDPTDPGLYLVLS